MANHRILFYTLFTLTAALLMPAFASGQAESQAQWGKITYPLPGNLQPHAGTLLIHFRIEEDVTAKPPRWYQPKMKNRWYRFVLLSMKMNDENLMLLHMRDEGMFSSLGNLPGEPSNLTDGHGSVSGDWNAYEQHWAGFSWDDDGTQTYWLDGKIVGQQGLGSAEGLGSIAPDGQLALGTNHSALTIYGIHILDHALNEQDLAVGVKKIDTLFKPMRGSLLLDRLDNESFNPDGKKQTRARSISGFSDEIGGTPTDACQFVNTPFGRGLRLYTPPKGVRIP